MSQAHEKGHYRELDLSTLEDLVGIRVVITPDDLMRDWHKMEAILVERLNRVDLTTEERVYFEDLLQEMNRQKDLADHKKLHPVLRERLLKKKDPKP